MHNEIVDPELTTTAALNGEPFSPVRGVFRPVQYLGNKLRSLPQIIDVVLELQVPGTHAVDLFSGTSLVSQALAEAGHNVTAIDAQPSCYVMATAMLGVERSHEIIPDGLVQSIVSASEKFDFWGPWRTYVDREDLAVRNGDANGIDSLNRELPLTWRVNSAPNDLISKLKPNECALAVAPLFAGIYAGTYVGIRQALSIDSLRWAIADQVLAGTITRWQEAALTTALMSALSAASFSAGKHFAQPLTAGQGQDHKFRASRIVRDRGVDIIGEFKNAAKRINLSARSGFEKHSAVHGRIEDHDAYLIAKKPSIIYADPPYTAQQYSRFYHALDTLVTYRVPQLEHRGRITTGLYPTNRFKSAFSSKRLAPKTFVQLAAAAKKAGAHFILSYSVSSKGSDGNDRMIKLNELLEICQSAFGKRSVEVVNMGFAYRQFNSGARSNENRSDPEILILCRQ